MYFSLLGCDNGHENVTQVAEDDGNSAVKTQEEKKRRREEEKKRRREEESWLLEFAPTC